MDFVIRKKNCSKSSVRVLSIVIAFFSLCFNMYFYSYRQIKSDEEQIVRSNYYDAAYIMTQIEKPKVFYSGGWGTGFPADILPACRYWIGQTGATKEMVEEREKDLKSGIADFVCVWSKNEEVIKKVESYGYIFYCYAPQYGGTDTNATAVSLFGRPGLKLPPEDFHVSQWDVWLKRNIFGI